MQPRLNIALKACRSASEIITKIYKSKDQDELRSYDKIGDLIYKHIADIIAESYPYGDTDVLGPSYVDTKILSDIAGDKNFTTDIQSDDEKYIWIINPLDSYENFVNKLPLFNITITIFQKGIAQATIIFNPIQDELVTAIKGEGAMHENTKIRNRNLSKTKILYVIDNTKIKLNIENMLDGTERFIGSKSTELIYMAEGKIDLIIYPKIHIWESAAGILICKESGVFVTDFNGNDDIYNSKSLIASKEWLHKKILPKVC
ncbi:MAG: inositol monophosphatase [Gammaproteobacteria bacterium]|nr:inositol monophosphatase [Gammaproteobacteria bacterium]